ncbi:phosphotransferase enzyme family protein [Lasiosphaeria ovina]|uniref:Phosphotransferase enzyme family protein n=1 Tax=Lasiosphaeria ovina TaxID=92902 RepID=A0AAE0JT57_9PEZI|nr:phosphotransferase enzyme family protein [Lasiosphaeria ovina]
MAPIDFLADKKATKRQQEFEEKVCNVIEDIVDFVVEQLSWTEAGQYNCCYTGRYNICLDISRVDGEARVIIRFPISGRIYGPWRDEKVRNEAMTLLYLAEHTTIPVPHLLSWGLSNESLHDLGPFLITDYMYGEDLEKILKKDEFSDTPDPAADNAKLDTIYEQIAGYMVQLSRLEFSKIGAISRDQTDPDAEWDVTGRPFTLDMNAANTIGSHPPRQFARTPSNDAAEYLTDRARYYQIHVKAQRNIAQDSLGSDPSTAAWSHLEARWRFGHAISAYSTEVRGPFRLFCDDLHPRNMLVDPKTLRITAVLDWEFTNAMPAQYAYDPPSWLLLREPAAWVVDGDVDEFKRLYVPRLNQFVCAVERAEQADPPTGNQPCLAVRMREAWDSRRFFFNLASRDSFGVDEIYWEVLHDHANVLVEMDPRMVGGRDTYIRKKIEQLREYEADEREEREQEKGL